MASSLYPSFIRIGYTTAYAPHIMTLPTLQWTETPGDYGQFDNHLAGAVDAETMIDALVARLADIHLATTTFNFWQIYTMASPTAEPDLRIGKGIAVVGTSAEPGWAKAVEQTIVARSSNGGICKLTLIDVPTNNNFDRGVSLPGDYATLFTEWSDDSNGWAARDNGRPSVFVQVTATLDEALRRSYRMT